MPDLMDKIMAYEDGQMDYEQEVAFFQELLASGMVWHLQGSYGRRAWDLMQSGAIEDGKGNVSTEP